MKSFFFIDEPGKGKVSCVINGPSNKNVNDAVIMCYGMNGNRVCQHRIAIKLERELEKQEIALIRFDYENVGTSEGYFEESIIQQRIDDLKMVFDYTRNNLHFKRVFLLGFSDGARNVMLSNLANKCDGVMLWNPILGGVYKNSSGNYNSRMIIHPLYKIAVKELLGVGMNIKMLSEMKRDNSIFELSKINRKSMIVFGTKDSFSENVREYIVSNPSECISIMNIENADHLFNRKEWEKAAIQITCNWLKDIIYDTNINRIN